MFTDRVDSNGLRTPAFPGANLYDGNGGVRPISICPIGSESKASPPTTANRRRALTPTVEQATMKATTKGPQRRQPSKKTDTRLSLVELNWLSDIGARGDELYALADAVVLARLDREDRVVGNLIACVKQKADELVRLTRKWTRGRK